MKTKNYIGIIIFFTAIIVLSSGCNKLIPIEGNGSIATETRNSVSFNRVENQGPFSVYVVPDTAFYVVIEAESNLISHIRTNVHGNVLEIDSHENLDGNYDMVIRVHTPVIMGVGLSGSGLVDVAYFESPTFDATLSGSGLIYGDIKTVNFTSNISGSGEIDFVINADNAYANISGSGNIILAGLCNYGDYKISGSGNIATYGLPLNECIAKISGSGNVYTEVSELLNVVISGSGNLYYRGNPTINTNITGSGQVIGQ